MKNRILILLVGACITALLTSPAFAEEESVGHKIGQFGRDISDGIKEGYQETKKAGQEALKETKEAGQEAGSEVKEGSKSAWSKAKSGVKNFWQDVKKGFKGKEN